MLKVIEMALCRCVITDRAMISGPDGNTICIHKRNVKQP
jgi:hypothetical protein